MQTTGFSRAGYRDEQGGRQWSAELGTGLLLAGHLRDLLPTQHIAVIGIPPTNLLLQMPI